VQPALLEHLPVEAGILTVAGTGRDATVEVAWHPRQLAVEEPGTRIVERPSGGARDQSAARFEYVDRAWKAEKRLAVAERAYERGWRSYVETMRPDCRQFRLESAAEPHCEAKGRCPSARECAGACPSFEPEPPAWRRRGWPIEGGPGRAVTELLARQRERRRP